MRFLAGSLGRVRAVLHGKARCSRLIRSSLNGKSGIEIGGPTELFRRWYEPLPIYDVVGSLDNCVFSGSTIWASQSEKYEFYPGKTPGKTFVREGFDLGIIPDGTYDFVLSSHNLEHFANPIRALKEWKRITRPGGALVLVLPYYAKTFDHRRRPTDVAHMFEDWERNTQEDDLTHLPEILELHDLSRDPLAGSLENFHKRSLDNIHNRCLHHHVFDQQNSRELLDRLGMDVMAVDLAHPFHLVLFAVWRK